MKFFDTAGNELTEGTPICFPLEFGQAIPGVVKQVKSGLGVGTEAQPQLFAAFVIPLAAAPNGLVPGVFATAPRGQSPLAEA